MNEQTKNEVKNTTKHKYNEVLQKLKAVRFDDCIFGWKRNDFF